jgi:hypothetical protein
MERGERQARVSIGTIEVTVTPPASAPPATAFPPPQPPPPPSGPPSSLTGSPAADRLRDGLRRWYGTAQG